MSLRGGVIIIGSLLWDNKISRQEWRKNDLYNRNRFKVNVPIRYGRCSDTRNNTYTMIFSNIEVKQGDGSSFDKIRLGEPDTVSKINP